MKTADAPAPAGSTWVGTEWVVEAHGCPVDKLQSLPLFEQICAAIVADLSLNVVGQPLRHQFPGPAGVTLLFLLSESHLACHSYPEHGLATFNLYCCRQRDVWPWQEHLQRYLAARQVSVRQIPRGTVVARSVDR